MGLVAIVKERRRVFLQERRRILQEFEENFERNTRWIERLERYHGKKARLYDSQKMDPYDYDKIWSGLHGTIARPDYSHAPSPYVLHYRNIDSGRWGEHYIIPGKIRSMKKEGSRIIIDAEWAENDYVHY